MINHSKGLEKIIEKRISQGYNYLETLRTSYGADPRDVWNIFRAYKKESAKKIGLVNSYPELPEPHPAYSQWRISPKSTEVILQKIIGKDYEKVCFLGCPVLGLEFQKRTPKKSFLLDIDKKILDYAAQFTETAIYDVNSEIHPRFKNRFECVITDPPWYYEDIRLFVKRASELVRTGGTIYLSLPSILTKPSIPKERLDLQKWLSDSRLIVAELNPIVEYEVPPFEYMAYRDIPAFTGELWRTGDWVKLKKLEDSYQKLDTKKEESRWLEYLVGEKRIFLRDIPEVEKGPPRLSSLYKDNSLILRTVSKRSQLISKIDIWSSRNAVLHIDSGFGVVKTIFDNLGREDKEIIAKITKNHVKTYKYASAESIKKIRELISE